MKTAVITGASDGIGEQAARRLAREGWQLAVVGRNPEKTMRVARDLGALHYAADFASLGQVRALAKRLLNDFPRIDLLANNAGGIFPRFELTEDGVETTFQVNHLSHFLLTRLLEKRLVDCKAKVITTSSMAHRNAGMFFNLDTVDRPRRYSQHLAYGNSKLANILFTTELDRRLGGQGVAAAAYHPGLVATAFARERNSPMGLIYHTFIRNLLGMLTPEEGADTLVWLADSVPGQDWQPGQYYMKRALAKTSRKARDAGLAKALWEKSEALCAPFLAEGQEG